MIKLPIGDFELWIGVFSIGNRRLVVKLPIGDFELEIGVFRIGDWGSPKS